MAFSDLGKLLEIVDDIAREVEGNLPHHIMGDDMNEIRKKIYELKQKEQFM